MVRSDKNKSGKVYKMEGKSGRNWNIDNEIEERQKDESRKISQIRSGEETNEARNKQKEKRSIEKQISDHESPDNKPSESRKLQNNNGNSKAN